MGAGTSVNNVQASCTQLRYIILYYVTTITHNEIKDRNGHFYIRKLLPAQGSKNADHTTQRLEYALSMLVTYSKEFSPETKLHGCDR